MKVNLVSSMFGLIFIELCIIFWLVYQPATDSVNQDGSSKQRLRISEDHDGIFFRSLSTYPASTFIHILDQHFQGHITETASIKLELIDDVSEMVVSTLIFDENRIISNLDIRPDLSIVLNSTECLVNNEEIQYTASGRLPSKIREKLAIANHVEITIGDNLRFGVFFRSLESILLKETKSTVLFHRGNEQ
jgi:hypothetical protein